MQTRRSKAPATCGLRSLRHSFFSIPTCYLLTTEISSLYKLIEYILPIAQKHPLTAITIGGLIVDMSENFSLRHIPTLFVATTTTFGGLIPFYNAEYAIKELGLPKRIAVSREAHPVMILSSARITALGALMFVFYFQGKLAEVDIIMLVMGAYLGPVDGYVCWREGVPDKAVFRFVSGLLIAAWGWFGMTAGP